MRIIDQQRVVARHGDRLDPPFDLYGVQAVQNVLLRHRKMAADRDGGKRVVHAEFPGNIDLHREIELPFQVEAHPEIACAGNQLLVFRAQRRIFGKAVGFQRAGVALQHPLAVFVVDIHDAEPALAEQPAFAFHVFRERSVLVSPDMVGREVGEQADVERESRGAVRFQADGGCLHHHAAAALIRHRLHETLHLVRFRCGVFRGGHPVADDGADRADDPGLEARAFQD